VIVTRKAWSGTVGPAEDLDRIGSVTARSSDQAAPSAASVSISSTFSCCRSTDAGLWFSDALGFDTAFATTTGQMTETDLGGRCWVDFTIKYGQGGVLAWITCEEAGGGGTYDTIGVMHKWRAPTALRAEWISVQWKHVVWGICTAQSRHGSLVSVRTLAGRIRDRSGYVYHSSATKQRFRD